MESCGKPNSFYHPQYCHKGIIKSIRNWRFMALDYHGGVLPGGWDELNTVKPGKPDGPIVSWVLKTSQPQLKNLVPTSRESLGISSSTSKC